MKKATKGAWIIHHANKLSSVTNTGGGFEQISFAGRCGTLLSAISGSNQSVLDDSKTNALARAAGISTRLELPTILTELERQKLISRGKTGIEVLGLTTNSTLHHTASIFEEADATPAENAVLHLAESASDLPLDEKAAKEQVEDLFELSNSDAQDLLVSSEQIGFIDCEAVDTRGKVYFNGNLFRRNDAKKIVAVLQSLSASDQNLFVEVNDELTKAGCVPLELVKTKLGEKLFSKLQAIGAYDVNMLGNDRGSFAYITRPSAFRKFSDAVIDDAFDLAKAFVASLTYGMTKSEYSRGRITMIKKLMQKLIDGYWVGPATAIGHDYKILEMKGVVAVEPANGMYRMKLLKRDVGEIALQVIVEGEASSIMATEFPGASVLSYNSPEKERVVTRKNQTAPMKKEVGRILQDLRTGKL